MPRIQELLRDRHNDRINYDEVLKKFPWINEEGRNCVLSPDSDGLLCALFMAKHRNWKIVGFYDDKVGIINKKYIDDSLIFLDGEIFRKNAKSMGHHMLKLNKRIDLNYEGFKNCIQPNLFRNYDGKNEFRLKYPLATIHMLIGIIAYADKLKNEHNIVLTYDAVAPLFFTDGVFNVLFSYPENVLNWLTYLRIDEEWNPLKSIFQNDAFTVYTTMTLMDEFFRKRDELTMRVGRIEERGDRLKISNKDGSPHNIEISENDAMINKNAVHRIIKFLEMVGEMTNWKFDNNQWECWENLQYYKFTKRDFQGDKKTLTNKNFEEFIAKKPLSWAMTSGKNIEYTLEEPSKYDFLEI